MYTRLVNEKRVSTYFSLTLSDIRLSRRHFKRGRKNYYCVIRKFLFKLTSYPWASTHARRRIRHYMTGLSINDPDPMKPIWFVPIPPKFDDTTR